MRELGLGLGWDLSSGGIAVPSTAVLVNSGARFEVAPGEVLAPGTILNNFFVSAWVRIDDKTNQYTSFFTTQGTDYTWLGMDYLAASAQRNIAYSAPNGGHALGAYGPTGVWHHIAWSIQGNRIEGWFDGAPADWDSGPSPNYNADTGRAGIITTTLRLLNEVGASQDFIGGIRSLAIGRKNAGHLLAADVANQMVRSNPFTSGSSALAGYSMLGVWPLSDKNNLSNAISGGPSLTLLGGTLGNNTTGPALITLP